MLAPPRKSTQFCFVLREAGVHSEPHQKRDGRRDRNALDVCATELADLLRSIWEKASKQVLLLRAFAPCAIERGLTSERASSMDNTSSLPMAR